LAKQYNKGVNLRRFWVEDYVLRKVLSSVNMPSDGKLGPNWVGPFKLTRDDLQGAYYLETMKRGKIPKAWNVTNIRKLYF